MPEHFSKEDKSDLRELFRLFDFPKIGCVNTVVAETESRGDSPQRLFDTLMEQYQIPRLLDRGAVTQSLHKSFPCATAQDVEIVMRRAEIQGLTISSIEEALRKRCNATKDGSKTAATKTSGGTSSSTAESSPEEQSILLKDAIGSLKHIDFNSIPTPSNPQSAAGEPMTNSDLRRIVNLSSPITRATMDGIIENEVRDWLCDVVGPKFNEPLRAHSHFVEALRNGVILQVLLQKLCVPAITDEDIKLPRRSKGFYGRDNVAAFIVEAKKRYELVDAQLFTDTDLCDAKDDRQVVTCLMSIAHIAYRRGATLFAPSLVKYEREIELTSSKFTKEDLDCLVKQAGTEDAAATAAASSTIPKQTVERGNDVSPEKANEVKQQDEPTKLNAIKKDEVFIKAVDEQTGVLPSLIANEEQQDTARCLPDPPAEEKTVRENQEALEAKAMMQLSADVPKANSNNIERVPKEDASPSPQQQQQQPQPHVKLRSRLFNVVWKDSKIGQISDGRPPRYVSKHWDGIDVYLGRLVNEHYQNFPRSPWRFRSIVSKSGEYILYNRLTSEKRIVYVRIIQQQLFLRCSQGSGGPSWEMFTDALEHLE